MRSESSENSVLYVLKEIILFYLQAVWQYMEMETCHLCIDEYEEQVSG